LNPAAASGPAIEATRRRFSARGLIRRISFKRLLGRAAAFLFGEIGLAAIAIAVAGVLLARTQAFFLTEPGPVAFDDGYTVALGERLIDGSWLPYVDGCSHRGPLLYWAAAIAQKLSGRFNWLGPRWLSVVLTFGVLLGSVVAGVAIRRYLVAAIAALVYVYVLSIYETGAAYGILGETVAAPFVVWSLALTALGLLRARRLPARCALLAFAGMSAALAGFAKQTALATIGPVSLWALLAALGAPGLLRKHRVLLAGAAPAGFVLVVMVVVIRYAIAGALGTFWYWYYSYNTEIYMQPYVGVPLLWEFAGFFAREHWSLFALTLASVAALGGFFARLARAGKKLEFAGGSAGFEPCLALLTVAMFVGAAAPYRFWPHYFLALIPLGALLAGTGVDRALAGTVGNRAVRFLALLTTLGTLTALTLYAADFRLVDLKRARRMGGWASVLPEPICDYIAKHSAPDSATFIWGFDSDLYVTCGRRPATRFLYLTLVAGNLAGRWWGEIRLDRVARGSREQIVSDLQATRPPVILDMPANMGGVSIRVVPELVTLLDRDYCVQKGISSKNGRKATPYLRRSGGPCR
jgi:hypothetical protein